MLNILPPKNETKIMQIPTNNNKMKIKKSFSL